MHLGFVRETSLPPSNALEGEEERKEKKKTEKAVEKEKGRGRVWGVGWWWMVVVVPGGGDDRAKATGGDTKSPPVSSSSSSSSSSPPMFTLAIMPSTLEHVRTARSERLARITSSAPMHLSPSPFSIPLSAA